MRFWLPLLTLLVAVALPLRAAEVVTLPEPGPEDGGLRMRLRVVPRTDIVEDGYEVRVDLINVSDRAIALRAGWTSEDAGDLKDYLDAATSIECVPAVQRWSGGVIRGQRRSPQPEQVLERGASLSVQWRTQDRHLKNRVTNPNEVQNPEFPFPGLYSVHATLNVITTDRTVALRSNEQLVPVGGSRAMPKHTLGQVSPTGADGKTAMLDLGSQHKVEPGDRFEHLSKIAHWRLTVTDVKPGHSIGNLELVFPHTPIPAPSRMEVTLVRNK